MIVSIKLTQGSMENTFIAITPRSTLIRVLFLCRKYRLGILSTTIKMNAIKCVDLS